MKQIPELLFLALDCYRYPSPYDEKRSSADTLPPGITQLLSAPDGCLSDGNISATATDLAVSPEDCRAALMLYVRLLLDVPGNHHRLLGLAPGADQQQVQQHYQLLGQLLDLGWEENEPGWRERYRQRVEEAWRALRQPVVVPVPEQVVEQQLEQAVEQELEQGREPVGASEPEPAVELTVEAELESGSEPTAKPESVNASTLQSAAVPVTEPATKAPADDSVETDAERGTGKALEALAENLVEKVEKAAEQPAATQAIDRPVEKAPRSQQQSLLRSPLLYVALVVLGVMLTGVFYAFNQAPEPPIAVRQQALPASAEATAPADIVAVAKPVAETTPAPVVEPAPEENVAGVSLAGAPEPSPSLEPEPAVLPISSAELEHLLQDFSEHYQAGDADAFANLFAAGAQTSSAQGRDNIRRYFQQVFAGIRRQTLRLEAVNWEPGAAPREGLAQVRITAAPARRGKAVTLENQLQFEVSRNEVGALEITRLVY